MNKAIVIACTLIFSYSVGVFAQQRLHRRCGTSMIMQREAANNNGQTRAISTFYNYVPHTGDVTIPVILVNFRDVSFSINNPKQAFEQFFNADTQADMGNGNNLNYGSVAKYFRDMSGGDFNLTFKVYGPVTLDRNETYYGGRNENSNYDEHPQDLVTDAIAKLQASSERINDASEFCSDGNSIACVYIVYAGMGQNDGGSGTTVWANTGSTASGTSIAGKNVRWYSMGGELGPDKNINGIGVTCHEFSHALGLPDIYPTTSNAYLDNQEMEYWDLMDGGEYCGNGYYPAAYTAFEKNEMGWSIDIQELNEDKNVAMSIPTEQGGTAYKIVNPDNSNEYFMLECIKQQGWNSQMFGNGLLVYHVNRPSGGLNTRTDFNNTPGYPGMAIVPADGLCASTYVHPESDYPYFVQMSGDLFPGNGNLNPDTLNVSELSDDRSQPNFCWYNTYLTRKLKTNKALKNIRYNTSTGELTFYYINDVSTGIKPVINSQKDKDNRIYSLDGRYLGNNLNKLPKGIYIIGGKKIMK